MSKVKIQNLKKVKRNEREHELNKHIKLMFQYDVKYYGPCIRSEKIMSQF